MLAELKLTFGGAVGLAARLAGVAVVAEPITLAYLMWLLVNRSGITWVMVLNRKVRFLESQVGLVRQHVFQPVAAIAQETLAQGRVPPAATRGYIPVVMVVVQIHGSPVVGADPRLVVPLMGHLRMEVMLE